MFVNKRSAKFLPNHWAHWVREKSTKIYLWTVKLKLHSSPLTHSSQKLLLFKRTKIPTKFFLKIFSTQNSLIFHHYDGRNLNFSSTPFISTRKVHLFASRLNLFIALLHNLTPFGSLIIPSLRLTFLSSSIHHFEWKTSRSRRAKLQVSPARKTFHERLKSHADEKETRKLFNL
jgi:hypothetical protein